MVEASSDRAHIKQSLLTMAANLFAQFDNFETVVNHEDKHYIAKQFFEDGSGCTMIKYRADGLTEEEWNRWRDDPTAVTLQLNSNASRVLLPDDHGHKIVQLKMKMPLMISNRSIVTCFYDHETEDGWKMKFHSSQGNEHIVEANAASIGKDVVASNIIVYFQWRPYEGGMEIWHVQRMNPNGSLPDMFKKKMGKRMANVLLDIVAYLKSGAAPPEY